MTDEAKDNQLCLSLSEARSGGGIREATPALRGRNVAES